VSGYQHGRNVIRLRLQKLKRKKFILSRLPLCCNVGYEKNKIALNLTFSQNCVKENNRIIDFIGKLITKAFKNDGHFSL
jgi:hypothetical protein